MSINQQPGQTEPAPPPDDSRVTATVDFLLAHAGLTVLPEERAWLVRAYTTLSPLLAELHAAPIARYAEPVATFSADPARR